MEERKRREREKNLLLDRLRPQRGVAQLARGEGDVFIGL